MGKGKRKQQKSKPARPEPPRPSARPAGGWRRQGLLLGVAALALIAFAGSGYYFLTQSGESAGRKETRATLSPTLFSGDIARAYQAAQEIPEVLDALYCYCHCEKNFGHKSLLTCYVDTHSANCGVCVAEALAAADLHRQGLSLSDIRQKIDTLFSRARHS